MDKTHFYTTMQSPLGEIVLTSNNQVLSGVYTSQHPRFDAAKTSEYNPSIFAKVVDQLEEYFVGKRKQFDLELDFAGTNFQNEVWKTLQKIPYGTTITYAQLANMLGNAKATRAVGNANGKNPLQIIIPCHRVIGSTGKYGGYNGGINLKTKLLELEAINS